VRVFGSGESRVGAARKSKNYFGGSERGALVPLY
jgi:hypothetical protein